MSHCRSYDDHHHKCGYPPLVCHCECNGCCRAQEETRMAARQAHGAIGATEAIVADLRTEAAEQSRMGQASQEEYWRCRVAAFLLLMAGRYERGEHL